MKGQSSRAEIYLPKDEEGICYEVDLKTIDEDGTVTTTAIPMDKIAQATQGNGIVLSSIEGRDILFLSNISFDAYRGGVVGLRYLVDGRASDASRRIYSEIELSLGQVPSSPDWGFAWEAGGSETLLAALHLAPNMKRVGPFKVTVGIGQVTGITPDGKSTVLTPVQ